MKSTSAIYGLTFSLSLLMSCGEDPHSQRTPSNQGSVNDLTRFMEQNPDISRASLKEIKDASGGGRSVHGALSRHTTALSSDSVFASVAPTSETEPETVPQENVIPETPNTLDPEKAKQAQALIDKTLDEFDFMHQIEAGFKMVGISFNLINQQISEYNSFDKANFGGGKSDFFDDKTGTGKSMPSMDKTGGLNQGEKMLPTCKEFLGNPYVRFTKKTIEQSVARNKAAIKEKLSGCAKIHGAEFVQCLSDYNQVFSLINQHATCDIKNFEDFEKTMNEKTDGKFSALDQSVQRCMSEQFSACGFEQEMPEGLGSGARGH